MGKMKKSVKAIIISIISVVCVLAIVLGLVFGLKKPDDPADNSKMTVAQKNLAKQVNENVEEKDYAITGVPYADVCTGSQLERFGLNYFSFKSGSKDRFYVYREKADGTFEKNELTDESKYSFVQASAKSSSVVSINDDYVLFVSYFDLSPYATETTRLYYSLVKYSDYDNPVEIFSFDSSTKNYYIPQNSFTLKDNYFVFSYYTSLDSTTGTADYNFYAYPYTDSKIDYSNASSKNFVSGVKYIDGTTRITHNDTSFVIFTENTYKVFYLKDGGFEMIERAIVSEGGYISKNYSIKEIFDGKLFITETSYISNNDDIIDTSVVTGEEGGAKSYVNYSYKVYDFSKATPTESNFNIEKGYAVAYPQDSAEALDDYFYISYESVDDENELTGKYFVVYYDKDFKAVIKYSASKQTEEILYAGTETFLTANRIISVNKNVNATNKVVFADSNLKYVSSQTANDKVVLKHNETGYHGIIDINGNVIIEAENSHYSNILDVSGDKCRVYYGNLCYLYDFNTKQEEYLSDYEINATLNSNAVGIYLSDNGDNTYSLKDYDKNSKISNITYVNSPSVAGVTFIEVSTEENKSVNKLVVIADGDKLKEHNKVTKVVYMGDSSNSASTVSASAETYATSVSSDYFDLSITQEKNPTMTLTMKNSWLIDDMNFYLHFFNDYTLHMYDMYLIENNIHVSWTYGGDYISHAITLNSDGNLKWTMQFSYTNWFGYSSVGIENAEGDLVRNLYYVYFLVPDKTEYSSTLNYFHDMTLFLTDYSGVAYYCNAIAGSVTASAPPASVNTTINTCYISAWRYYGTSSTPYTNLAPDDFSSTSNVPASGSISGASVQTAASAGDSFTIHTRLWYNSCHYYAYYIRNSLNIVKDYQGYGTDATLSTKVTSEVSLSAPNNRPGYNWVGWKIGYTTDSTTKGLMEDITHYYMWSGVDSDYTAFTGTSVTLNLPSGASSSTILKLKCLRNSSGSVYVTPVWELAVYTITLDNGDADISAGTAYLYEKYNTGIYFNSACSSSYYLNSASSLISLPNKTDYSFSGYFTKENGLGTMVIDPTGKRLSAFKNTLFTADSTIYAYWSNIQYTITYDDGVVGGSTTTLNCYYGKVYSVVLPSASARPGYSFTGWAVSGLDGECNHYYGTSPLISSMTQFTGDVVGVVLTILGNITHFYNLRATEGDVTLQSQWAANYYLVDFVLNGGTGQGDMTNTSLFSYDGNEIYTYTAYFDTPFTINADSQPTKDGYNFAGWVVASMETGITHTFSGSGVTNIETTEGAVTITPSYVTFLNLRQTHFEVDGIYVICTAQWTEITYYIQYELGDGSWDGNEGRTVFGKNESGITATAISMSDWFVSPAPSNAPFGYKFGGWSVSGTYLNASYEYEDYDDYWNFCKLSLKQMTLDSTDAITITAVWDPIVYYYEFLPGAENVTINNVSGEAQYNIYFSVNHPQRTGFLFKGWALTNLSDKCLHYVDSTSFSSLNGSYVSDSNPNEFIPAINSSGVTTFKNLHCIEGETVTLTAMWEYEPYDLVYYYTSDSEFSSLPPSESDVNNTAYYSSSKTHTVMIDSYFTTLSVASSEYINDGIIVPTGYQLVGWVLGMWYTTTDTYGSTGVYYYGDIREYSSKKVEYNAQYKLTLDFILQTMFNAPTADEINSTVILGFKAYAVYEPVDIMIKIYEASSEDDYNKIQNYSLARTLTASYGSSFSITNLPTDAVGYMLSVNNLNAGTITNSVSISSYTYNGTSYPLAKNQMTNIPWGMPNTSAYNPNEPEFFMYTVYAKYDDTNLFSFAYNSRLGGYTLTGVDALELSRQTDAIHWAGGLTIPSTYDDGIHGSASVVSIGAYAFAGVSIDGTLTLHSGIVEIGSHAFDGFSSSGITGGSGIARLDRQALVGSSNISGISTSGWKLLDAKGEEVSAPSISSVSSLHSYASGTYKDYIWVR